VAAERVHEQGPLTDQSLAHLQDHALSLLRDGLHGHEMHARPPRRFTDRLGVVAIVLAALNIRFDVLGWDETHLVTERDQFASPIMCATAGFHGDLRGWQLPEERDHLRTAEIDP
jgi:hypothetical protein